MKKAFVVICILPYGTVDEDGFFFGPLSSMATLALLGTSIRTGYCFQF